MWISRKEYEALKDKADFSAKQVEVREKQVKRLDRELYNLKLKYNSDIDYALELKKREEGFKVLKLEVDKMLCESGMNAHLVYLFSESGIKLYKFPMTDAFKKAEETASINETMNTVRSIVKNYQTLYDSNHKLHEKINKLEESLKEENIEKLLEIKRKYFTLIKELDI